VSSQVNNNNNNNNNNKRVFWYNIYGKYYPKLIIKKIENVLAKGEHLLLPISNKIILS